MKHRLWEAIDILEQRGWCTGRFESVDGRVCLVGAIRIAYGTQSIRDALIADLGLVADVLRENGLERYNPALWNDFAAKNVEEVKEVLTKAAIKGDELVD